jgi:chromosome segregation ATPase
MEVMKHIAYVGFGFALFAASVVPASAQQSQASSTQSQNQAQPSLADYARQIKKDSPQPKAKPKVFDNDNLPKNDKLSVVGEQPPAAADQSSEAKPADSTGNVPAATDKKSAPETKAAATEDDQAKRQAALKEWQQKLTAQKDQIDLLDRELDVLKREYQIRAAAFYADAGDRLRNSAAWDKQDTQYKQQIADKQKALDDAKQKLEEMQEDARKAGIPAAMREP